jgi:hypothetical protein
MSLSLDFIQAEISAQTYELSVHADDERLADHLTMAQVEYVLFHSQMLELYANDPRGESCLVLGFTPEAIPVHIVCGRNRAGHLLLITVYIPTMPKWKDPYTRNR